MNNNLPLVSVVVPNYNHEKYLVQRLESIFNQTYSNFEVILLDDCSTDNSRFILNKYASNSRVSHCVFNDVNTGNTFVQWNKGIQLAKGDFIWIAESDDFCDFNFIEHVIKPLLENSEVVLSYCQSRRVDENGLVTGNWKNYTDSFKKDIFNSDFAINGKGFFEKYLVYKNVIPNASAVIFRKNRSEEIEKLDESLIFRCNGDWLYYSFLIWNKMIAYKADSLNNFRYHSKSVIATSVQDTKRENNLENLIAMRRKIIDYFSSIDKENSKKTVEINLHLIRTLKYEKSMFLIRNKNKIKGAFFLIPVLDIFLKKYKFKKNIKIKVQRLFDIKTDK